MTTKESIVYGLKLILTTIILQIILVILYFILGEEVYYLIIILGVISVIQLVGIIATLVYLIKYFS